MISNKKKFTNNTKPLFESPSTRINLLLIAFGALAIFYFHWRLHTLNPNAFIFSVLMLLAELYGLFTGIAHFMMTWRLSKRKAAPPPMNKTVDIFIPTYNESIEIVERTVIAAVQMDYPHTTWLLDDGNRPEFREMAERNGAKYIARPTNEHAKAGNLNYGLAHSSGEFIGIFDADHVPSTNFIVAILGYFNNPNVAFVQTPQDFYNLDSFQHRMNKSKGLVWTEQSLFFRVIQRGKDYWNAAFFCGSCALVRRSCLDDIGGFATDTITEDLHTSIRLHKKGYESVYHEESLAFGIAPSTIKPFLTQRIRWGQGAMQVWKKEGIIFDRKLTIPQRINYLASLLTYFDGWQKGFFYITPVIVLCTGWVPISTTATELMIHLVPYALVNTLLTEELARGYGRTVYIEQYNMARFYAFAYATLSLFIPRKLTFKVTDKENKEKISHKFLLPQRFILYANIAAIPVGALMYSFGKLTVESFSMSVFWAIFNLLLAGSVLSFSKIRQSFQRSSYRFSLPHVVKISVKNCALYATIDDISSDGCRIYLNTQVEINRGECLRGTIYLPGKNFDFSATVVNIYPVSPHHGNTNIALGCLFNWDSSDPKYLLESYLYRNNHQFKILAIGERDLTPLEKILSILNSKNIAVNSDNSCWIPLISDTESPIGVLQKSINLELRGQINGVLIENPPKQLFNVVAITESGPIKLSLETLRIEKSIGANHTYYICKFNLI